MDNEIIYLFFYISMCIPVPYRPRLNPLLRGLLTVKCVKVYGRILKLPPVFPEMKFCLKCFPAIIHRHHLKPLYQHECCQGPFTIEHCRKCKKVITEVQSIHDCGECFPMYIQVYKMLNRTHNMNELDTLHFDIDTEMITRLDFLSPLPTENPDEDRDNILEPYM